MSQYDFGTINPANKSGTALASDLNSWRNALHSSHIGSSRPVYVTAGTIWVDDAAAPWTIKMYDGADDISLGTIDPTGNVFTVAGLGQSSITWTATQTFRAANAIRSEVAATQDAIVVAGRAGGTGSYAATITPTTLSANRTVTLPDATGTVALLNQPQIFTTTQYGTRTTDNDGSFNLSVTNLWKCTPTAGLALTFTNPTDGISGNVIFVNSSNYAVTAHANTKVTSSFLATISVTGTYIIQFTTDGTNTHCCTAGVSA